LAINLYLPENILLQKLLGRRKCKTCKKSFNIADINDGKYVMPPLNPDKNCNTCHGDPIYEFRDDDKEEVIQTRLTEFYNQTQPLEEHLTERGILKSFEPCRGLDDYE